jgi:uncharacterized protein YbjT (DUF2867 family)
MYVVAGVSGRTGSVVASALLEAGKPTRVIVRDAAKGERWRDRGAEVAVASLEDEQALGRALEGAVGAYLLSPQDPRSPDPITAGWKIAHAVARALEKGTVKHLVFLSALGAEHAEGTGIARTLHAAEERLAEVPPAITFLRAAYLLDNWASVLGATSGGKLPTFIAADRAIPMVAARDVGGVAARALLEGPPASRRTIIEVHGPRDYSPRDLAGVLAALVGHPVDPDQVPLPAVIPIFMGFGATPGFAEQIRQLYQGINEGLLASTGNDRIVRGTYAAGALFEDSLGTRA